MKKICIFFSISFVIIFLSIRPGYGNDIAHGPTIYVIQQGDTLWDISEIYLNNPYLWPYIWVKNKYIRDPDIIYPGEKLLIPYVDPKLLG